jgi:hypothetical protein
MSRACFRLDVLAANAYLTIISKIGSVAQKFGLNDVFLDVDLPIYSHVLILFEGCCGNGFCRSRLT